VGFAQWFEKFAQDNSPTYSNNALHALKKVFDCALDKRMFFRNPSGKLERVTVPTTKLELSDGMGGLTLPFGGRKDSAEGTLFRLTGFHSSSSFGTFCGNVKVLI